MHTKQLFDLRVVVVLALCIYISIYHNVSHAKNCFKSKGVYEYVILLE